MADKSKSAEEEPKNRKELAEWAKASQIYKDALAVDREMTREETKRARENFDKVNGPLKEPPALTPSGKTRNTRHGQRTQSFELYEDFLYYQNPAVRRFLEKKPREIGGEELGARNKRYRRNSLWNDPVKDRKMGESFLYAFHEQGIGGPSSRSRATGHDSLHLWMPERRRRPMGLGKPDFPKCRPRIQPYQLKLDIESIENRRNEVELKRRGQTNVHATHNELRQSIMSYDNQ